HADADHRRGLDGWPGGGIPATRLDTSRHPTGYRDSLRSPAIRRDVAECPAVYRPAIVGNRLSMAVFSDQGFLVVRDLFSHSELGRVAEALGPTPSDRKRGGVRGLIGLHEVRRLAEDPRLLQLAGEFLGASP